MDLVEIVRNKSPYDSLTPEEQESNEFFLACIKAKRFDIAVKCKKFVTREFIIRFFDEIFAEGFNYTLYENEVVRDVLIEKGRYDLLLYMKYSLLAKIEDPKVIAELDRLADMEIAEGHSRSDYVKFRAMKLKKYDMFTGDYASYLPFDEEFYDLYYDDLLTIIDKIKDPGIIFYRKCLLKGDFEIAIKYGDRSYVDLELVEEVVRKHWDKVLAFCEDGVKEPFTSSKILFDHYMKQKRFDRICQFSPILLEDSFIKEHEQEFLKVLDNNLGGAALRNRKLFELCLKNRRFDLAGQFDVRYTSQDLKLYGVELMANIKKVPYTVANNPQVFRLALEAGRFDLLDEFFQELITDDILREYGDRIIEQYEYVVPYQLRNSSVFLMVALRTKRYDLVENFYDTAYTDEVYASPEFFEFLKVAEESKCYRMFRKPAIIPLVIKAGRTDLYYWLLSEDELHVEDTEYLEEIISKISTIPLRVVDNRKVLKACFKTGRGDLCRLFSKGVLNLEEDLDEYINSLSEGAVDGLRVLNDPKSLKRLVELERYDLITELNIRKAAIDDEVMMEIGHRLLLHAELIPAFAGSQVLCRMAFHSGMMDKLEKFQIRAFDDTTLLKYGDILYPILTKILKNTFVSPGIPGVERILGEDDEDSRLLTSKALFDLILRKEGFEFLNKFDPSLFTPEIIDAYFTPFLEEFKKREFCLSGNEYFFRKVLDSGNLEGLYRFNGGLFTKEIMQQYGDAIVEYFRGREYLGFDVSRNKNLFRATIERGVVELIPKFKQGALDEQTLDDYYDFLVNVMENQVILSPVLQVEEVFLKLLQTKRFDIVKRMGILFLRDDVIFDNFVLIKELVESDYESAFAKNMLDSQGFLSIYLVDLPIEKYSHIDMEMFESHFSEYYPQLVEWIQKYNGGVVPFELFESYSFKQYLADNDLVDLYLCTTFKERRPGWSESLDKIFNIDDIVETYAPLLKLTPEELREKIDFLRAKNDEILLTIVPRILEKKYDVLSLKHKLTICLYPDLQIEIIGLNDKELVLLDRILDAMDIITYDTSSIVYNVIFNLKHYGFLVENSEELSEEQLNNLILVLQRKNNVFGIESVEDLTNLRLLEKMLFKFKQFENTIKEEKDIEKVREMVLLKKYGLDNKEAKFISDRYCLDQKIIRESNLDEQLKAILIDINNIVNCQDIEELKFIFSSSDMVFADFKSTLFLEEYIRCEYAKLYDQTLYRTQDKDLIENKESYVTNKEALEQIRKAEYKGQKPKMYLLTDDFNLQIHALGAYSEYVRPEDFLAEWNQPKMASHGVCTSYIGNNQIANARAYHPILGFDTIEGDSLLLAANYDIGSGHANLQYATSQEYPVDFLPPREMIDYTRHTHNEIVVERMKYVNGMVSKRQPSYVVYLVDDVNNKYNFMTKKELIEEFKSEGVAKEIIEAIETETSSYFLERAVENGELDPKMAYKIRCAYLYEEVVQASIDMGIPIVIVDRLLYAKKETRKCELMFEQLVQTKDPSYISLLLVTYCNNMIGCIDYFDAGLEYCNYFNENGYSELFNRILNSIELIENEELKIRHLEVLLNELKKEDYKRNTFRGGAASEIGSVEQYIDIVNKKLKELKPEMTEGYNGKNI